MGSPYTKKQKTMKLHTSLPLLSITEPALIHNKIKDINNRLRVIDREVIILESERSDLYIEKAKALEKQDKIKKAKELGTTNVQS